MEELNPNDVLLAKQGVTMVTERREDGITYSVLVGRSPLAGDRSDARIVWTKVVVFTPTAVSGGPAFVRVAREQERVSARYVAAARERNP